MASCKLLKCCAVRRQHYLVLMSQYCSVLWLKQCGVFCDIVPNSICAGLQKINGPCCKPEACGSYLTPRDPTVLLTKTMCKDRNK